VAEVRAYSLFLSPSYSREILRRYPALPLRPCPATRDHRRGRLSANRQSCPAIPDDLLLSASRFARGLTGPRLVPKRTNIGTKENLEPTVLLLYYTARSHYLEQEPALEEANSLSLKNIIALATLVLLAGSTAAIAGDLTLHPSGFGKGAFAAWKAQQGLPDSVGNANHALYFQKMVPTATFSAGVAVINGIEGQPVSSLQLLSWQHRDDGHCGAGAPRWNLGITGASGARYTLFLGCAAAAHALGSASGWTTDSYAGATIVSLGGSNAGLTLDQQADAASGTIASLAIVFDEGTDQGQGFVFLDNITVNDKVWTSPADNRE
jgi:hypothetical protein